MKTRVVRSYLCLVACSPNFGCAVFRNFDEYVAAQANVPRPPNAFLIGSPPMFRGTTKPGTFRRITSCSFDD
jgi:hypothetical protein